MGSMQCFPTILGSRCRYLFITQTCLSLTSHSVMPISLSTYNLLHNCRDFREHLFLITYPKKIRTIYCSLRRRRQSQRRRTRRNKINSQSKEKLTFLSTICYRQLLEVSLKSNVFRHWMDLVRLG